MGQVTISRPSRVKWCQTRWNPFPFFIQCLYWWPYYHLHFLKNCQNIPLFLYFFDLKNNNYKYNWKWFYCVKCCQFLLIKIKQHDFYLQCIISGTLPRSLYFAFYIWFQGNKSSSKDINFGNLKKKSLYHLCYQLFPYSTMFLFSLYI